MQKNINFVQALEKAVKEKYGDIATMNPKHFWDENKEKKYIEDSKIATKEEYTKSSSREKIEVDGILVSKMILSNKNNRSCAECRKYSFNSSDDMYLNKFNICYKCYLIKEDK